MFPWTLTGEQCPGARKVPMSQILSSIQ